MDEPLMVKCMYREDGIRCGSGLLHNSVTGEPLLLEGTSVYCPACGGKGMIPTDRGRELLAFFEKFGWLQLRDIVNELFREHGR